MVSWSPISWRTGNHLRCEPAGDFATEARWIHRTTHRILYWRHSPLSLPIMAARRALYREWRHRDAASTPPLLAVSLTRKLQYSNN